MNQCGVDVSARDDRNRTALHWAALGGCIDSVAFLMNLPEADLTARDNAGNTPLDLSTRNPSVYHLLLETVLAEESSQELEKKLLLHLPKLSG